MAFRNKFFFSSAAETNSTVNTKADARQNKKTFKLASTNATSSTSAEGDKYHTYHLAEPVGDTYANSENIQRFEIRKL